MVHSSRQRLPRSSQNPTNRRRTRVPVSTTRASALRNRLFNRTSVRRSRARNPYPAAFPGGLNFQFPSGMDLDMVCFSLYSAIHFWLSTVEGHGMPLSIKKLFSLDTPAKLSYFCHCMLFLPYVMNFNLDCTKIMTDCVLFSHLIIHLYTKVRSHAF